MRKILVLIFLFSALSGEEMWSENGPGFNSGTNGSGIHWHYGRFPAETHGWVAEGRFYDLKGDNEVPAYDPVYGTVTTAGGISLVMLTFEGGLMYFPFADKIANNFSPYVAVMAGPNIILDAPETGSFTERWGQTETSFGLAVFLGAGISFYISHQTVFGFSAGYDFLKLPKTIDGKNDYSGFLIKLTYSRRK